MLIFYMHIHLCYFSYNIICGMIWQCLRQDRQGGGVTGTSWKHSPGAPGAQKLGTQQRRSKPPPANGEGAGQRPQQSIQPYIPDPTSTCIPGEGQKRSAGSCDHVPQGLRPSKPLTQAHTCPHTLLQTIRLLIPSHLPTNDTESPKDKCTHTGPAPGNAQKRPDVGIGTDEKIWLPLNSWEDFW